MTVVEFSRTSSRVHCTVPLVTLKRVGFKEDMVEWRYRVLPQLAGDGGCTERVVLVWYPNSMPAAMLVPTCIFEQQHKVTLACPSSLIVWSQPWCLHSTTVLNLDHGVQTIM